MLDKLSLKYCGIDGEGSKYIQEILANIHSKLRSLKLQGRYVGIKATRWETKVCFKFSEQSSTTNPSRR